MEKKKHNRKAWFRGLKKVLRLFISKPKFKFLGDEITEPSIIISNHVGSTAPLKYEMWFPYRFRFWGTYEMNSGLISVYKYLSNIFYHQKKHWPLFWARAFSIIAAPLANMFYKGLNLISTYPDFRFKNSLKESHKTIDDGDNLIIFPEDSSNGYHDTLTYFYSGFIVFARQCLKRGKDLPIFAAYYQKETKTFVIDKPVRISELLALGLPKEELAEKLLNRTNDLAKIDVTKDAKK